ncbi:MAG: Ig-like domain-containing protein [Gemmatimonadota bacterium]
MTRGARAVAEWLCVLLAAPGCARTGFPEGGPEDRTPPAVVVTLPEDRAIDVPADAEIEIVYDEPLAVGTQAQTQRLVLFNPDRPEVVTNVGGRKIEIQPQVPLEPQTTYSLTILPGLQDRRSNRTQEPVRVLFSTGGPLTLTLVKGVATQGGRPVAGATVRAVNAERELGYTALTDSAGAFELPSVALGTYAVTAWNETNATEGFQFTLEAGDTTSFELPRPGSGVDLAFELVVTDTSAARPVRAEPIARAALTVTFTDSLDAAAAPDPASVDLLALAPDVAPRGTALDSVPQSAVRGERVPVAAARVDSSDVRRLLVELEAPLADSTAYAFRARGLRNRAQLVTPEDAVWLLFRTRQVPDSSLTVPPAPAEEPGAVPGTPPEEGAPPAEEQQPDLGPGAVPGEIGDEGVIPPDLPAPAPPPPPDAAVPTEPEPGEGVPLPQPETKAGPPAPQPETAR